jgi:hypothetical protein
MEQFVTERADGLRLEASSTKSHLRSACICEPTAIAPYNIHHDYITHSPSLHGGAAVNIRLRHTPFHLTTNTRRPPWRPLCATHSS